MQQLRNLKHNGLFKSNSKVRTINRKKRFYEYLLYSTSTCNPVAEALNIPQKSCTRYKRQLEEQGKLQVIKLVRYPITGFDFVQLITANETLFPKHQKQLSLWK